jgi:RimJ/RimL family protein N-acetyltransferase
MSNPKEANITSETWSPIVTERLLLREFEPTDTQGYYELESNEENAQYQDWPPRTLEQSRELVSANIESSHASPRTTWELVVEKDGYMVGRVGAALSSLNNNDPFKPTKHFNLWFSFLPSVQGKGYATEAMTAFIEKLVKRQDTEVMELEIECDPRNAGSWKLAERLGFEKYSLTEKAYESKSGWVGSLVYRKIVTRSK